MSTPYLIPLRNTPQTLTVTLAGTPYQLATTWNTVQQVWQLSVADASGNTLIGSLPLVTGRDLFAPYRHLGLAGQLQVQSALPDPLTVPGQGDLGVTGFVYFIPDA